MTVLIINDITRKEIENLKLKASLNVITLQEVMKLVKNGKPDYSTFNKNFTMRIPNDTYVTFTHEEQPGPIVCRHMSVSTNHKGKVLHPEAFEFLMNEFGFINKLGKLPMWKEKFGNDNQIAINVLEPLSGDLNSILKRED